MAHLLVNGEWREVDDAKHSHLLGALRDGLGLTGAKYGCGEGRCGACTVLVDGTAVTSCTVRVADVDGARVTTVEGLGRDGDLHPVQREMVQARAFQCGYCTPGMVMAAVALLESRADGAPALDAATVTSAMAGNICRCGGYPRIVDAVLHTAEGSTTANVPRDPRSEWPQSAATPQEPVWTIELPPAASEDLHRRGWGWTTPGGVKLTIDAAGRIRAYVGKVDAGQGNRHAFARLVAAHLAVATSQVDVSLGDTATAPYDLGTFGSRSMPDAGQALRVVAQTASEELLAEAAARLEVPVDRLHVQSGAVCEIGSGRAVPFGALVATGSRRIVADAGTIVRATTPIGEVEDESVRPELVDAVTGAKKFPSDMSLPGLLHGRVLRAPAQGARLTHVDTRAASEIAAAVVHEGDFVAVAAADSGTAARALEAVVAEWEPSDLPSEAALEAHLRGNPVRQQGWGGAAAQDVGDVDAAFAAADTVLEATYRTAYIAHVPLEPRVALADIGADGGTVWVGTQRPFAVREQVASALDLPQDSVRVVVPGFGGGFGGKHSADVAVEAARLSRAAARPVRVAWTRHEEFCNAYLRPAAVIDVRSASDGDGTIGGWQFTNVNSGPAALAPPYDIGHQRLRYQPARSPFDQGSYRALAATANNFARECHIDEIASHYGFDPVDLRLRQLADERLAVVLRTLADRIGWATREPGAAVGIACGLEKDARVATAARVSVEPDGRLAIGSLVTVVDCGAVVDPDGLRAQIVGATIMGLGGALFEAIRFEGGRILNANLTEYRVPRFTDVPPIDVVVLDQPALAPAGAGETPIITVAPAIANAIHAATGRRIRSLPLAPTVVFS